MVRSFFDVQGRICLVEDCARAAASVAVDPPAITPHPTPQSNTARRAGTGGGACAPSASSVQPALSAVSSEARLAHPACVATVPKLPPMSNGRLWSAECEGSVHGASGAVPAACPAAHVVAAVQPPLPDGWPMRHEQAPPLRPAAVSSPVTAEVRIQLRSSNDLN